MAFQRPHVRFALAAVLLAGTAGSAQAELVTLVSGRTLSVRAHRYDGDLVVLTLRGGGDVTCDRTLIESIVPDEVPQEPAPVAAAAAPGPVRARAVDGPFAEIINTVARAHGVDPLLVGALIQVESNFRPGARSHKGAMGLMQLMPSTARRYNLRNPYDPHANVAAGVQHLKSLIDRWGEELALAAYNAGEGAVKKFNGIPPYRETRSYVRRILSLARAR